MRERIIDIGQSGHQRHHHPGEDSSGSWLVEPGSFSMAPDARGGKSLRPPEPPISPEERARLNRQILTDYSAAAQHLIIEIIPKELPPAEPVPPEEAIRRFNHNLKVIKNIGLSRLPTEYGFMKRQMESDIVFMEEKEKYKRGEKTPIQKYKPRVSGYSPDPPPRYVLEAGLDDIQQTVWDMGHRFTKGSDASLREAFAEIQKFPRMCRTPREVRAVFESYDKRYKGKVGELLGVDLNALTYDFRWEEADEFWKFWEFARDGKYGFRVNWHPRHRPTWSRGAVEDYVPHEMTHIAMAYLWADQIKKGNLDPFVFTAPGPGCFGLEAIALNMSELARIDKNQSQEANLAHKVYREWMRARARAVNDIEQGMSVNEAVYEYGRFAPNKTKEEVRAELVEGTETPFGRAYLDLYGQADYELSIVRNNLQDDRFLEVVKEGFKRPLLREEIVAPHRHSPSAGTATVA